METKLNLIFIIIQIKYINITLSLNKLLGVSEYFSNNILSYAFSASNFVINPSRMLVRNKKCN